MPARKRSSLGAGAVRRRSGRLASTTKESVYFGQDGDAGSDDAGSDDAPPAKKRRGLRRETRPSPDYEESHEWRRRQDGDNKDGDDDDDDDDDDEEDDDDDDEDAPPRVEIIPLEKLRDDGGVAYQDDRLHRNTLLFLADLKANNKRPWLKSHDGEYRRALADWQSFVEAATQHVIDVDDTVPELPTKDVVFRIHRDIRFSKDPTPYKPHFSAAWSRTGRKGPYACYYLHCEPGSSFVGGGLWHPEARLVAKLRRSIHRHPDRWRRALAHPALVAAFFPALGDATPDDAVKAFVAANQGNALKKRPMGWDMTHPDIELLKLRNYTIGASIDAAMLCRPDAQRRFKDLVRALSGFVTFLNSVVMPDGPESDDNDDDGDQDS